MFDPAAQTSGVGVIKPDMVDRFLADTNDGALVRVFWDLGGHPDLSCLWRQAQPRLLGKRPIHPVRTEHRTGDEVSLCQLGRR